eukprot:4462552-Lingulodinium_polyedra.AAC.1
MECANARFGCCGNETSIRPRRSAAFVKCCAMTWPNRHVAATTARKPHARALHARTEKSVR